MKSLDSSGPSLNKKNIDTLLNTASKTCDVNVRTTEQRIFISKVNLFYFKKVEGFNHDRHILIIIPVFCEFRNRHCYHPQTHLLRRVDPHGQTECHL